MNDEWWMMMMMMTMMMIGIVMKQTKLMSCPIPRPLRSTLDQHETQIYSPVMHQNIPALSLSPDLRIHSSLEVWSMIMIGKGRREGDDKKRINKERIRSKPEPSTSSILEFQKIFAPFWPITPCFTNLSFSTDEGSMLHFSVFDCWDFIWGLASIKW